MALKQRDHAEQNLTIKRSIEIACAHLLQVAGQKDFDLQLVLAASVTRKSIRAHLAAQLLTVADNWKHAG